MKNLNISQLHEKLSNLSKGTTFEIIVSGLDKSGERLSKDAYINILNSILKMKEILSK